MKSNPSYYKSFIAAIGLHLFLIVMLLIDNSNQRPVLISGKDTLQIEQPIVATSSEEVVKAVSVDSKQVMETVNRLKQEREQQKRAEIYRQNELKQQAEVIRQQRIKEQQQLARLKEEAKHIEELKKQKEELVKQQQVEIKKLAELNKKREENKLRAEQAKKAQVEIERKKQIEAAAVAQRAAAQNVQKQALLAGEVNKYKALIVNAIGQNWILPENADSSLSSQFRIHLAPDGMVLEVTLIRSSGDPLLDRSAQTAIYKASPLPVPKDQAIFNLFRDISLTVRPEQVRG